MQDKIINTFSISTLSSGIVRIEIIENEEMSHECVAEIIREVEPHYKGNKLPLLLVVIPNVYAISFSAMREAKNNRGAKKLAIVTKRNSMVRGLQLAFRVVKFHFPIRFFNDEESGKEWLLEE